MPLRRLHLVARITLGGSVASSAGTFCTSPVAKVAANEADPVLGKSGDRLIPDRRGQGPTRVAEGLSALIPTD